MRTFSRCSVLVCVLPLLATCGQAATVPAPPSQPAPRAESGETPQAGKPPRKEQGRKGGKQGAKGSHRDKIEAKLRGGSLSLPEPEAILANVRRDHPRLVPADRFERLAKQVEANAELRAWFDEIKRHGAKLAKAPPVKPREGRNLRPVTAAIFERVLTFSLIYQVERQPEVLERMLAEVRVAGQLPDWNPEHFLDTSELAFALAVAYDWNYDDLTPKHRELIRGALVEKALLPALECFEGRSDNGLWVVREDNWNTVCNGGIGIAALAVATEEPELAGPILHGTLRSIQVSMAKFAPAGGWEEGPTYLSYAAGYGVAFMSALASALGTDFGLSDLDGFADSGEYLLRLTSPTGASFNYADAHEEIRDQPHLLWMASRFGRPELSRHAARFAKTHPLNAIWFERESEPRAAKKLPLDRRFKGVEIATFRSDWDDPDGLYVGFKAGDNKASHAHLDVGSFVLDALGERWALDLGPDDYGLPGYFEFNKRRRWTYYRTRAEGHNTIVLDPGGEPDQDPEAETAIVKFESKPERAFAIADLTPAYRGKARTLWRGIQVLDRERVLVQDELRADRAVDLHWFLHTRADVQTAGNVATLRQGDAKLEARILSPAEARFEVREAVPMKSSPQPDGQDPNRGVRKLSIQIDDARDVRLVVLLTPYRGKGPTEATPEVEALERW